MKLAISGSIVLLFTLSAEAGTFLVNFDSGKLDEWQELLMSDALPGSWEIVDGELHAVSPDGWTRLLTIGDETWRDYTIEFDVKPLDNRGPSNIVVAARINGSWVVWCLIGDLPFVDNISEVKFAAGNFQDPNTFLFSHSKRQRFLKLNEWSKLKLDVKENILNFWINGKQFIGPVQLPNRQSFLRFDALRKEHRKELPALQLDGLQDFLTGGMGLGLSNQTARFDNVVITGDSIPDRGGLSVTPKAKLATVWGSLKRF
ncbi:DUF1080 domain-containing protein [Candidatus Poribacteria bacterium]|nr:DUF1080 domain-containing protein [Candidatus Poribacteria bacterium]MYB00090.1 DUF1080 domain-containing protein [Candidatus Poribacteria bacterium]